jgi:hypothetical protein
VHLGYARFAADGKSFVIEFNINVHARRTT